MVHYDSIYRVKVNDLNAVRIGPGSVPRPNPHQLGLDNRSCLTYRDAGGNWWLIDPACKRLSRMLLFWSTTVAPQVIKLFLGEVGKFIRYAGWMLDGDSGNVTR